MGLNPFRDLCSRNVPRVYSQAYECVFGGRKGVCKAR